MKKYKLRSKVTIEDKTNDFNVQAILPSIFEEKNQVEAWRDIATKDTIVYNDPRGKMFGYRAIVPSDSSCKFSLDIQIIIDENARSHQIC